MKSIPRRRAGGKKPARAHRDRAPVSPTIPSPAPLPQIVPPAMAPEQPPVARERHPYVARTEIEVLATEWRGLSVAGEMGPAELTTAPLPLVLLHTVAPAEGTPVASLLYSLRSGIEGIMHTATAGGETFSADVTLSVLDGWRRMVDGAIELDRRGAR